MPLKIPYFFTPPLICFLFWNPSLRQKYTFSTKKTFSVCPVCPICPVCPVFPAGHGYVISVSANGLRDQKKSLNDWIRTILSFWVSILCHWGLANIDRQPLTYLTSHSQKILTSLCLFLLWRCWWGGDLCHYLGRLVDSSISLSFVPNAP